VKRLIPLLIVLVLSVVAAQAACAAQKRVHAKLSGSQEVPPVKTEAKGKFILLFYQDALSFELNVKDIMNPTGAYIHQGKKGENGPAVAGLFAGPAKEGLFKGVLAQGTITQEGLLGDFQGKTIADLVRLLKSGNA
jgi:hypothetical protein